MAPDPARETRAAGTRWDPGLPPVIAPEPAYWCAGSMAWIVSRYEDAQALQNSGDTARPDIAANLRRIRSRSSIAADGLITAAESYMPCQHGAAHPASREAVGAMLAGLHGRWTRPRIAALASELADALPLGRNVDLAPALIDALPNRIAADVFGLDNAEMGGLRQLTLELIWAWRPGLPLREYARLEALAQSLYPRLEREGSRAGRIPLPLTPEQARIGLESFLIPATVVTISNAIGTAMHILAQQSGLQRTLRQQPGLIDAFIDEAIRLRPSLNQLSSCKAVQPLELGGVTIPQGSSLIVDISRASRDAAVYEAPDMVELGRKGPKTLAFGAGAHRCMGPMLARLEMRCAIEAMLARFDITPAGPPEFLSEYGLQGFTSLPVSLVPAS